jgi:elongation factor P
MHRYASTLNVARGTANCAIMSPVCIGTPRRSHEAALSLWEHEPMATTSDLRTNIIIRWNGQLHRVTEFHHHAPGNWRAMVIMKLKNMQTGKTIEERVRAGSEIDIVRVEKRPMQFLYRDGDTYHVMDTETFEQLEIPAETMGDAAQFLKENEMVDVLFYDDDKILGVEAPIFVELKVVDAPVAVRGDTATSVNKTVTLETGATIQAPAFINVGDTLKIDTRTGSYIERV